MTNDAIFDELSVRATQTGAIEDSDALFGAVFDLSEWHFIARGELPDVYPYVASNAQYADNQPMIRAFTDPARLARFARENNLTEADGSCQSLSIPTQNIVEYLEKFVDYGAFGVWFNSDSQSDGFFIPIKQLRIIKERLERLDSSSIAPRKSAMRTGFLLIRDGLGFPSGFVSEADYALNIYFHVPSDWTDGGQLKTEAQEKIFEFLYGADWRNGNDDGSRYVVINSFSTTLEGDAVKNTPWEELTDTKEVHYRFYLADEDGAIRSVKSAEFQAEVFAGAEN